MLSCRAVLACTYVYTVYNACNLAMFDAVHVWHLTAAGIATLFLNCTIILYYVGGCMNIFIWG